MTHFIVKVWEGVTFFGVALFWGGGLAGGRVVWVFGVVGMVGVEGVV